MQIFTFLHNKVLLEELCRQEIFVCYGSYIGSGALLAHYLISTVGSFLWDKVAGAGAGAD